MSSGETALEFEAPTRSLAGSLVSRSLIYDILLASAANAVNQADRNIMPIAVIPMAEEFGWSMMQRGLILSSFAYGYILTQLPGGWIATLLPPLKLLLLAVSVWSLATLLTPAAAGLGLGAVFACRVVLGVAEGFCLPAIFQLFARSVPVALRSRAFSFMLGCGSVGQLGALLLCPQLAPWPAMFLSFGGLGLGWAALCVLRLWCGPPAAAVERRGGGGSAEAEAEDGASAAEEESGLLALSLTALPFAVNAVANVGFGLAADRAAADRARRCSLLGVRRAATLTGLLGPAACHLLFPLTASPGVAICIVTLSFFLGAATASGYMANHADLSRHYAGLTFAIANTVATVPGLVAPPFTAWLLDATGSWAAVFVLAALINVACAFAYLVLSDARTVL